MKKLLLLTAFLFCLMSAAEAQHQPADILAKADSIVVAAVGQRIFDQCYTRDETAFYYYLPKKKAKEEKRGYLSEWRKGVSNEPTKGIFRLANIMYTVRLEGADFSHNTYVYMRLDSALHLESPIDTAIIPQYVWEGKPCNFITKKRAAELAEAWLNEKDYNGSAIEQTKVDNLDYHHSFHAYLWVTSRKLWEAEYEGKPYGKIESVRINAVTGEAVFYDIYPFGGVPLMED